MLGRQRSWKTAIWKQRPVVQLLGWAICNLKASCEWLTLLLQSPLITPVVTLFTAFVLCCILCYVCLCADACMCSINWILFICCYKIIWETWWHREKRFAPLIVLKSGTFKSEPLSLVRTLLLVGLSIQPQGGTGYHRTRQSILARAILSIKPESP